MLYAVIKRMDSLREISASMLPEANRLLHIGITNMPQRSTLSDATCRTCLTKSDTSDKGKNEEDERKRFRVKENETEIKVVYIDRTAGRNSDHCDIGRNADAGAECGTTEGNADFLRQSADPDIQSGDSVHRGLQRLVSGSGHGRRRTLLRRRRAGQIQRNGRRRSAA